MLVIDDFNPVGSSYDVQRWHKKTDRIIRGKGNAAGRERLRGDLTARPSKPPRALILSTGEDTPRGQSLRARTLILEHERDVLDWKKLTRCQKDAREGLYAQAMAGFISWLAKDYEETLKQLPEERQRLREKASRGGTEHMRTPGIIADLKIGLRYFLSFAQDVDAISKEEAEELWKRGKRAITRAGASQAAHQGASDATVRFRELLSAAIASGRAHVAHTVGSEPEESAEALGWRKRTVGTGEYQRDEWQPRGDRVGWVKGEDLYLEPEASYRAVQAQAQGGEPISVGAQTLRKRLKEKGVLLSTDEKRQTLAVRRTIEGVKRNVLHLGTGFLFSDTSEPDKPDTRQRNPHSNGDSEADSVSGAPESPEGLDPEPDIVSGSEPEGLVTDSESDTGDRLSNAVNDGDCRVCRVSEEDKASPSSEGAGVENQEGDSTGSDEDYELVKTQDQLEALTEKLQASDSVAVDLETVGLNPATLCVRIISVTTEEGTWLVDCFAVDPATLLPALTGKTLVFHNALFDLTVLVLMGLDLGRVGEMFDTMVISRLINNETTKMEEAA